MKFCSACGAQLSDGAAFCGECGIPVSGTSEAKKPAIPTRKPSGKKLHCPECGSTSLSPVVESTSNGGVAISTPFTKRVGITSYGSTTTHRNYWICQDCGHKFRNLQNLKEELARETKFMKGIWIFSIFFSILLLLTAMLAAGDKTLALFATPLIIILIGTTILFWCLWLSTRNKVVKMMEEKRHLESHCFGRF